MRVPFLLTLVIVGVASCTTVTRPPARDAADHFRIVLDQPVYTQREASEYGITATVTNTSRSQDFYANVGDAFNSAVDQPTILAAKGTHAIIERRVSASVWKNANSGVLFEGSKFVVLRAGKSYLLAGPIAPQGPGTYRIRLDYSAIMDDPSSTPPFHDYSATFRVR